jgi:uncharacterized protein (DUF427 family)
MQRIEPGEGQESVWDYPRPPRLEEVPQRLQVIFNGETVAETVKAYRVLETSSPPTYYIPPEDVVMHYLSPARLRTQCEWKGVAAYWDLTVNGRSSTEAAWSYPSPTPAFVSIRDYISFYAGRVEACYVGDERVQAQAGDFYGGWITSSIVGPFKGAPGTLHW